MVIHGKGNNGGCQTTGVYDVDDDDWLWKGNSVAPLPVYSRGKVYTSARQRIKLVFAPDN